MRFLSIISVSVLMIGFTGCEDKKEANLYKAQLCLDKATTAAAASQCTALIEGQNNERANAIRCSAGFVSNGIDESALAAAVDEIDGSGGGDPTAPALAALSMTSKTESSATLAFCQASGSPGLARLAEFADISTTLTTGLLGLTPPITGAQVETAIDSFNGSPGSYSSTEKEDLGATVVATQDSLCNPTTGMFKGDEVCNDINAAVAANPGNNEAIADALLQNLNTN